MKKISLYILAMAGAMLMTGCADDFLDQENTTNLNQGTFFNSDAAIEAGTAPLYNYVWNDFNSKFYYGMGDGRANNITAQYSDYIYPYTNFTDGSLSQGLADAWNSLYNVVSQSNNTIVNITEYSSSAVSEQAKTTGIAEARFMRGLAYWYIGSLWGGGIIYTKTSDYIDTYASAVPSSRIDVMEFAIRDMEYAAKNLPATQATAGRVTKYSAYGMLSRFYLSMAGLVSGDGRYDGTNIVTNFNRGTRNTYYLNAAAQAAKKVITESSAKLVPEFGDLFSNELTKANNNSESLFQLQWLTGSTDAIGWGANNSIAAFFGWSTMVSDGTNWGGATYCSWDLWKEFNLEPGDAAVRRHYSVASIGEVYPEFNKKNGGYIYGETENAGNQGANIRKYVVGTNADNGYSYKQSCGVNTYMMRLAEVYLNYAEAVLANNESTSDAEALQYFNMVRERAKVPAKSAITYEDLRHERRVEFAFEGLYWYDLLRRSYYQQQEVVNYINNQQRNASYGEASSTYDGEECAGYCISSDYAAPGPSVSVATERNLVLQVPDADQGKCPNLKPDPATGLLITAPYVFGEREVTDADLF